MDVLGGKEPNKDGDTDVVEYGNFVWRSFLFKKRVVGRRTITQALKNFRPQF
jgi:hypothetical protein